MAGKKPPKAPTVPREQREQSPLAETLERLMRTDPKELEDVIEQNRKRADDIRRSVDERRAKFRTANQGPAKRFRP